MLWRHGLKGEKGNIMILTVKKESEKLVAEFEDKGNVRKYECEVSACENPVCTCADVYIELIPMPAKGQNCIY